MNSFWDDLLRFWNHFGHLQFRDGELLTQVTAFHHEHDELAAHDVYLKVCMLWLNAAWNNVVSNLSGQLRRLWCTWSRTSGHRTVRFDSDRRSEARYSGQKQCLFVVAPSWKISTPLRAVSLATLIKPIQRASEGPMFKLNEFFFPKRSNLWDSNCGPLSRRILFEMTQILEPF